jgi:hypothetical protein
MAYNSTLLLAKNYLLTSIRLLFFISNNLIKKSKEKQLKYTRSIYERHPTREKNTNPKTTKIFFFFLG